MLDTGHLLGNRYRLDERIATGGMGDVWRGTDVVLGRVVAVKVLKPAMLAEKEFSARFYGEARMMAAVHHPGVVEVYDYASADDTADPQDRCAYLVMAYVEGEPLATRLRDRGRLGVVETLSIVGQAADALHAAHERGTVHRDVKPGNLIIKPNGTVILVDFGVARSAAVTSVTGVNSIVGTALYMAPEQVARGTVTARTDIYALGAVAYHCLAGVPPFDGDNALQVALRHLEEEPEPLPVEAPPGVVALIERAMAKQPADRYADAAELADAALAELEALGHAPTRTGTRLTAPLRSGAVTDTAATRPLYTGAPTGPVPAGPLSTRPLPADAVPAVPAGPASRRAAPGRSRGQLAVLVAVVLLLLVAGGLAVYAALGDGGRDPGAGTGPAVPPAASTAGEPPVTTPADPTQSTRAPQRPAPEPTTATSRPPRTTPPTSTAPPTTKPTSTAPTSSPPTTSPTATTPTTPPASGPTERPRPRPTPPRGDG